MPPGRSRGGGVRGLRAGNPVLQHGHGGDYRGEQSSGRPARFAPTAHRGSRLANNANVLVLGMRLTGEMAAKEIVNAWLATGPSDEPRRIAFHRKTDEVEREYQKNP